MFEKSTGWIHDGRSNLAALLHGLERGHQHHAEVLARVKKAVCSGRNACSVDMRRSLDNHDHQLIEEVEDIDRYRRLLEMIDDLEGVCEEIIHRESFDRWREQLRIPYGWHSGNLRSRAGSDGILCPPLPPTHSPTPSLDGELTDVDDLLVHRTQALAHFDALSWTQWEAERRGFFADLLFVASCDARFWIPSPDVQRGKAVPTPDLTFPDWLEQVVGLQLGNRRKTPAQMPDAMLVNVLNLFAELRAAISVAERNPEQRLQLGVDFTKAATGPSGSMSRSFDLRVVGANGKTARWVEVTTVKRPVRGPEDLETAILHGVDKSCALPPSERGVSREVFVIVKQWHKSERKEPIHDGHIFYHGDGTYTVYPRRGHAYTRSIVEDDLPAALSLHARPNRYLERAHFQTEGSETTHTLRRIPGRSRAWRYTQHTPSGGALYVAREQRLRSQDRLRSPSMASG